MKKAISIIKKIFLFSVCTVVNRIRFSLNSVDYERFPRTRGFLTVSSTKPHNISMGRNVIISSGPKMNPVGAGGVMTSIISKGNGKIKIGNNVGMANVTVFSLSSIEIEDNVMLGNGVTIYDNDFHSISYEDRVLNGDKNIVSKPVIIKEGAFIGAGSIILKGVSIGNHSVIGAGSVVTKSVPDNEIWAGNPAKHIKNIDN